MKKKRLVGWMLAALVDEYCKFEEDFLGEQWAEIHLAKKRYRRQKYKRVEIIIRELPGQ